jgi:superfamily II DNA or RNA helicase
MAWKHKLGELKTDLLPHQQRVVDRIQRPDQPGLLVVHGLGSGKTLTSIAAQDALKVPATVVAPAALQENYEKEREKHLETKGRNKVDLTTMQAGALHGQLQPNPMVIVDEAHRMRDPSSKTFKAIRKTPSSKRLLLTGSPFYNRPSDISPLINVAAGQEVLPTDPTQFTERYVATSKVVPGLWDRIRGVKPGEVESVNPRRAPELRHIFGKWIDYHPGSTEDFPEVSREDVRVPMSAQQHQFYRASLEEAPPSIIRKIEAGLPPSKTEKSLMGAFLSGARQISNTPEPFQTAGEVPSPKIEEAAKRLQAMLAENPRAKAVVYSNFLGAGIDPYQKKLQEMGIAHGAFTGEMRPKEREQMVRDYNEGKIKALLLSGAGGEGLDLRGTRLMQILEPAWNEERIKQVEGRGARYKSHADLTPEERKVRIERYLATIPEGFLTRASRKILPTSLQPKKKTSTDEYLANMSNEKDRLIQEFKGLFPQAPAPTTQQKVASAKAYLRNKLAEPIPDDRRVSYDGRSLTIKELVKELADRIRAAANPVQKQAESMPDEYLQSYTLSGDGRTPGFALPQQTFANSSAIMPLMPGGRGLGSLKRPPMVRIQKKFDGGF